MFAKIANLSEVNLRVFIYKIRAGKKRNLSFLLHNSLLTLLLAIFFLSIPVSTMNRIQHDQLPIYKYNVTKTVLG